MIDQAPDAWHDAPRPRYGGAYILADVAKQDADAKALRSFWRGFWVATVTYMACSIVEFVWWQL